MDVENRPFLTRLDAVAAVASGALGTGRVVFMADTSDGLGAIAPSERRQSHGNQIELTAPEREK